MAVHYAVSAGTFGIKKQPLEFSEELLLNAIEGQLCDAAEGTMPALE